MSYSDTTDNVIRSIREEQHQTEHIRDEERPEWRMIHAMERCADRLEDLLTDFRLSNTRRGELFSNRITISANSQTIKIDFIHPGESVNLPSGVRINSPMRPVPQLIIINEGTGNLVFSCPRMKNDWNTQTTLLAPATGTNPVPLVLDFKQPVLERINLNGGSSGLTVNLIIVT